MGKWGSDNFQPGTTGYNPLMKVVQVLPANAKQAMLAAAKTRTIKRGTWSGCAWNQAGVEVGQTVNSNMTAASVFGCDVQLVSNFIGRWDSLKCDDATANRFLIQALENAGIFREPGDKKPRIVSRKIYENQERKLREQFDALMAANMVDFTDEAEMLLCGASC